MKPLLRNMTEADWSNVAQIYKEGIDTNNATFEKEVPSWDYWNKNHLQKCRIVALIDNEIVGWVGLSPISNRCVFEGVAEVSIYVANKFKGKKIGLTLLQEVIKESEKENIWTLESKIFPENIASIQLHEKVGFRNVGYRERIGKMNGIWRNIVILERRSKQIGND